MTSAGLGGESATDRARAWRDGAHAAVCDVLEPWAHGTIARATDYPDYWGFNVVRVEEDPAMSVEELEALADEALAGLEHRRLDFDVVEPADALRAGFEAKGWTAERLLWMRHQAPLPAGLGISVEEVRYDAVLELRTAWHNENFPAADPSSREAERQRAGRLLSQARAVSMLWDPRVLTVSESGAPIAYAQLEREGAAAEITQVYVLPEYRGAGRGTAMTRAAIEAAGDVEDLWIVADDDDRAKKLYARLGFRPVWTTMELTRPPPPAGGED